MFNLFSKKEKPGEVIAFKIDGMHCSSCSINIDGELEDTEGVFESSTHFARGVSTVRFDPKLITVSEISSKIKKLGYSPVKMDSN